jgi:hypothetical protein
LELSCEKLQIPDTDRQTLAVFHAVPGSASAQALALLASIANEEPEPGSQPPEGLGRSQIKPESEHTTR